MAYRRKTSLREMDGFVYSSHHGTTIGEILNEGGVFESGIRHASRRMICNGMVVYDVGANEGLHSVLFSHLVGDQGEVVAFEPTDENIPKLNLNLTMNKCRNTEVVHSAVWSETKEIDFYAFPVDRQTNSSAVQNEKVKANMKEINKRRVPAISLDDYAAREGTLSPSFIKIDTEGCELAVLQGAKGILKVHKPIIIMEYYPKRLLSLNIKHAQFAEILNGYDCYEVCRPSPEVKHFSLEPFSFDRDLVYNNILCIPSIKGT